MGRLFKALAWLLQQLPEAIALGFARLLGNIWYYLIPIRRGVVMLNLRIAFPERSYRELQRLCRLTLISFMYNFVEFTRIIRIDRNWIDERITVDGIEILEEVQARGQGGVVVSGHLGNWEIMGAAASQLGYPVTYIVKRVKDQLLDDLINGWRSQVGVDIIYAREAKQAVTPHLRAGRFVAFMVDQDAGSRGVWIDFFNQPASTARGAAVYALRTGTPVLFMYDIRRPHGRHHVVIRELQLDRSGEIDEEKITAALTLMTRALEEAIREHPTQYMWMHHRWRSWFRQQERLT
ncbi:MAG: lysophospholipid acyltransferase family protein [Candidatus Delongbacteria bacterium]|nr:lysophospholipid acyltransferase family protein [Candidatus Delongbacteria bacterium]